MNLPKRNENILIEVVKVRILALLPTSVKKLSVFHHGVMLPVGFSYTAFIMLRSFLLFLVYWVFFYHQSILIFNVIFIVK